MPGSLPSRPELPPKLLIICFMKRNFCTSSFTASTGVPEPFAMRVTRVGSRTSSCGSRRSARVIDWIIASIFTNSSPFRSVRRRDHAAHARDLLDQVLERAHLLDHADLLQEVVEGELALHHARGVFLGLLLIDDVFEVLHQADDVAHAEHAARHALGAELLELVGGFAHAGEHDRRAGDLLDAERRAAARVAVELGQHDAGDAEPLVERARGLDRVLADHRVDDEEDVLRARSRS